MNQILIRSLLSMRRIPSLDPENPPLDEISIDSSLIDLVRLRVALMNECPLCISYHTEALREHGESDLRILQLRSWTKSALFTDYERAAFALADSLVAEASGPISKDVVQAARAHFNDAEILQLVLASFAASDWNYQAQHYPRGAVVSSRRSNRAEPHA